MNEITIVKRRTSRLLPIVLTLIVVAILLLAGLWMLGMLPGVPQNGIVGFTNLRIDGFESAHLKFLAQFVNS